MGPALGPIIGGLLNWFLGWRAIFWFLAIYGAIMWLAYFIFIPESCRNIVGNGSLPAQRWNRPLIDLIRRKKDVEPDFPASEITIKRRPGIMSTIPIICEKESFLTLWFGGIMYAGYYIVLTSLPEQLAASYHYNSLQVGLCYLPIGFGPLLMRPIVGRIMDRNFRRHARKLGIEIVKNRQTDTEEFPIEKARLEISLICVYLSGISVLPYGWVMGLQHPPLPAALVLLFIMGACQSGAFQPLTALIIDLNPTSAGAATAAFNFVRCILGAGGVAVGHIMTQRLGRGWTSTVIACVWAVMSLSWWSVIIWGPKWRKARVAKMKEKEEQR
jgi:MFS family permease